MRLPSFFLVAALAAPLSAQTLWGIDSGGQVIGQTGPASGPCSYPLGPLTSLWSYATPGQCATPGATGGFGVPGIGGIGIDRKADELWITDGLTAAAYTTYSTPVVTGIDVAAILGGVATGIDTDPSGRIWLTNGASAVLADVVITGACYDAVPFTSFALPIAGAALALSHDPITDALWVVDDQGMLTHVLKNGQLGPFGSVHVTTTSGCGLAAPLLGVAADTAGPAGRVVVTDGTTAAVVDMSAGGALAAPTFYQPSSCWPLVGGTSEGIVVAANGNLFGASSGGPLPAIGAKGQSIVPNPLLAIELGGAKPDDVAVLVLGKDHLCPALTVLGVPFHVAPTPLIIVATTLVNDTGFASIPLPLGVGTPIGQTVFLQWGIVTPATFAVSSTRGMAMTTSLP
jgi:hypothetical protein